MKAGDVASRRVCEVFSWIDSPKLQPQLAPAATAKIRARSSTSAANGSGPRGQTAPRCDRASTTARSSAARRARVDKSTAKIRDLGTPSASPNIERRRGRRQPPRARAGAALPRAKPARPRRAAHSAAGGHSRDTAANPRSARVGRLLKPIAGAFEADDVVDTPISSLPFTLKGEGTRVDPVGATSFMVVFS